MIKIAPSTNPVDEKELVAYVKRLQELNVDYIHCDVMDGKFVDNKCLSFDKLKDIKDNTLLPLDVHLMVEEPNKVISKYCDLRCALITVHFEAFKFESQLIDVLKEIRKSHAYAGISIKPMTPVKNILHLLSHVDYVLIMGVEPGRSGQKMLSNTCPKVKELRSYIYENNLDVKIQVDGGVNEDNIKDLANAGVDNLVMGSAFYKSTNKQQLISKVHKL